MILTPDGGVGSLPFLAQGLPGMPPVFDHISVEEVPPGQPLPSPNPVATLVTPGGSGTASHYNLKFYIHAGATGPTGANHISTASDLATTPALGETTNGYVLAYRASDGKWVPTPSGLGGQTYTSPPIAATGASSTNPRLLTQISVPPQPFDWRPRCFGQVVTDGSIATRIDVIARVGDPTSGDMVGYSRGMTTPDISTNIVLPAFPAGASVPGSHGRVAAGSPATIYLRAEQKNATIFGWSTKGSPDSTFCLDVQPIL